MTFMPAGSVMVIGHGHGIHEGERWEASLQALLFRLNDKDEQAREAAAEGLTVEVKRLSALLGKDAFARFMQDLNRRIFEMVSSAEINDKLGAIILIEKLVEGGDANTMNMVPRYANYIRSMLPCKSTTVMEAASESMAKMVKACGGGHLALELLDSEFIRINEWFAPSNWSSIHENQLIAGCLLIRDLFRSVPMLAFPYGMSLLERIWAPLSLAKGTGTRDLSVSALREILLCLRDRADEASLQDLSCRLPAAANKILNSTEPTSSDLAALICIRIYIQLFPKMPFDFDGICDATLNRLSMMDQSASCSSSREAAIEVICQLAALNSNNFSSLYLPRWTAILKSLLQSPQTGSGSIRAVKLSVMALGSAFAPSCETLLPLFRPLIQSCAKGRLSCVESAEVMDCISVMAKVLKTSLSGPVRLLFPDLLACRLDASLRLALQSIVSNLPNTMALLEDPLLDALTLRLKAGINTEKGILDESKQEDLVFICETVSCFTFLEPVLESPLADLLLHYIISSSSRLRVAAAMALLHLIKGHEMFPTIMHILTTLVTLATTDEVLEVRVSVLEFLAETDTLDFFLSSSELFGMLLMILSSGPLPCRLLSVKIIERLSKGNNCGLIFPHFRGIILQLLADLSCPKPMAEEAAVVLAEVSVLCPPLMKPTVEPLLRSLSPLLLDSTPTTATAVLTTFGRLVLVNPGGFKGYPGKLIDSISTILADQSSSKRRLAALEFLSILIKNIPREEVGFERLGRLLMVTTELLKTELVRPVRNEAMRLLGVIGALDPYRLRQIDGYRLLSVIKIGDGHVGTGSNSHQNDASNLIDEEPTSLDNNSTMSDDYYPRVAINSLLVILRDSSLKPLHESAIEALLAVCKSLGVRSSAYLEEVIPVLLGMLISQSTAPLSSTVKDCKMEAFLLSHLATLCLCVGLHIRPYAREILQQCRVLWPVVAHGADRTHCLDLHVALLRVFKSLAEALSGEQCRDLQSVSALIIGSLTNNTFWGPDRRRIVLHTLGALSCMTAYTQDSTHAIVASILSQCQAHPEDHEIINLGLWCVLEMADRSDIRLEVPLLIALINVATNSNAEVQDFDIKSLRLADRLACYLALNFSEGFHALRRRLHVDRLPCLSRLLHSRHTASLAADINLNELSLSMDELSILSIDDYDFGNGPSMVVYPLAKLAMDEFALRKSWDNFSCNNKEDWIQWIRKLENELLKESPSPSLRACALLASRHYPLAKKLFNAAFVATWSELNEELQDELVAALETALSSDTIPTEVMQTILNLAEFMERDDRPLPIEYGTLGAYAMKCHAYAKALYYEEAEFQLNPSTESVEALISINSQLQSPDGAMGILVSAQKDHDIVLEESWYEKLQRWDEALDAYHKRLRAHQSDEALLGIFRCWHALGDWDALNKMASDIWHDLPSDVQSALAPLVASSAWAAGLWDKMAEAVAYQPINTSDGSVFRAVLAIKRHDYSEAARLVTITRELLDTELTAMLSESYNRAYSSVVRAQMLTELEEVIQFCQESQGTEMGQRRREIIKKCWNDRLDDCQFGIDTWQRLLKARSLIQPPEESIERYIRFAILCQRNGRPLISKKIFLHLLHADDGQQLDSLDLSKCNPMVVYGYLKYNWEVGEREKAFKYMKNYTRFLAAQVDRKMAQIQVTGPLPAGGKDALDLESQTRLLARCYLKLGDWQSTLASEVSPQELIAEQSKATGEKSEESPSPINPSAPMTSRQSGRSMNTASSPTTVTNEISEYYLNATSYDKNWYRTWHGWALINFEMAMSHEKNNRAASTSASAMGIKNNPYLVPAIQGFIRSISLNTSQGGGNSFQDSLRLLTLWFKYGGVMPEVNAAVGDGFHSVPVENWLQVIPQLIARIHVPSPQVRRLIHHLLADIGKQHPQALVYPLTVASKSQSVSRKTAALAILDKMRSHSARLVEQAIMVSQELIRVAILWEEMWYEGLEEASKLYFNDQDVNSMLTVLEPLHVMIEKGHETSKERAFLEAYGGDLKEAREKCYRFKRTGNPQEISGAWDLYYQVFRRISKALPQLSSIDLTVVSPKLVHADGLELAIPGTYKVGDPVVRISSFNPMVGVISSKQRPRKLVVLGSDGLRYKFLLKGHEDLRQDERVMQLFGLVNTLLDNDPATRKRHLAIERFSVIPLSQNTGLIGWVPHCDTIHSLIRDYRDSRGVLLSIEHRLMLQFAPDYDHLPLMNKVEVFDYAMVNTDGKDLGRIMWRRSLNSETWLERRLAYTRSLALMCMVGYILGLGDRHPSNLMIDQVSGRVVHIDFGDCFEVAMFREKFPEKVPFRLTRMLIRAMEVSGVEGTFRTTCEESMRVLRANKDSLMAVLEAFVYDPLINWRLLARTEVATGKPSLVPSTSGYNEVTEDGQFPDNFSSSRRVRRDSEISRLEDESINRPEAVNAGALNVINRVSNKLTGRDFASSRSAPLSVPEQIDRLIHEATDIENLCQAYVGWCAFW